MFSLPFFQSKPSTAILIIYCILFAFRSKSSVAASQAVDILECPCFDADDIASIAPAFCGPNGDKVTVLHTSGRVTCTGIGCGAGNAQLGCVYNAAIQSSTNGGVAISEVEHAICSQHIRDNCVDPNRRRHLRFSADIENVSAKRL